MGAHQLAARRRTELDEGVRPARRLHLILVLALKFLEKLLQIIERQTAREGADMPCTASLEIALSGDGTAWDRTSR